MASAGGCGEERMRVEPVTLEGSYVRHAPLSLADHPRL
jgi:hypothetical protein